MKIWLIAQYRVATATLIGVLLASLALLVVVSQQGISERTVAASLLILCFAVFMVGAVLYTGRAILKWQIEDTRSHMLWERGFVIGATLTAVLGLALLDDLSHSAGDSFLSHLSMMTYLVGALLLVVAETALVQGSEWNNAQVVIYVVLAFLAQAAMGASLLQTGLVAAWVGWVTLIWNLGWLLVMVIVRPRDIYYPVLHFVAPLIIGIALLQ